MKTILVVIFALMSATLVKSQCDSSLIGKATPFKRYDPIYNIDGLFVEKAEFKALSFLEDEIISSYALNSKKGLKKYGKLGENGVVEIKSKFCFEFSNGVVLSTNNEKEEYLQNIKRENILKIKRIKTEKCEEGRSVLFIELDQ